MNACPRQGDYTAVVNLRDTEGKAVDIYVDFCTPCAQLWNTFVHLEARRTRAIPSGGRTPSAASR